MKRKFYFQDDKSNKFWTIELIDCEYITTHGRIGAKPRETSKKFTTKEEAKKKFDNQISLKIRKGYIEGTAPEYEQPDWASMNMSNEETFWRVVSLFDWKKTGDDEAVIKPAVRALAQMNIEDIKLFEDILAKKLFALDTEAHAREIGEEAFKSIKHFSTDWFLYVRCAVVANGSEFYLSVLEDPTLMPKDIEFEAILTVASDAYEHKTSEEFDYVSEISYETYSNKKGWRDSKDK